MGTPWNDDPAGFEQIIEANARSLIIALGKTASSRQAPRVELAQDWHRALYQAIPLPVAYYAGEVRDTDRRFPELVGYEVTVGGLAGVRSRLVPDELSRFEAAVRMAIASLDRAIPPQASPDAPQLMAVLRLCAIVHGEWARIHPFANGNGRTDRVWANWVALRYRLPAFVRLKPRPAHLLYAGAAAASMRGDHAPMTVVFHSMLRQRLLAGSGP